jgi:D-glycero-beta-D-manno-heptose 1-phosphate adenylyltransferase
MYYPSFNQFLEVLAKERKNKKVVFTNGCFDLLHVGHVRYLQEAKSCGDLLVVALNTDASVQKLKGPTRPIQNQEDRAEILAALGCVDFTILFSQDTPLSVIEKIKPDVLVKGGDWPISQIVGSEFVLQNGGSVKSLQFVNDRSTTGIVDKLK